MTDIAIYALVSFASSALTSLLWMRRTTSWSDDDHYALVEKYYDAASALTAMKAELDKTQEQLEFSEDVRYTLGMENAKLVKTLGEAMAEVERGEEVRWCLVEAVTSASEAASDAVDRADILERSLRIARHKEFKRWKKLQSRFAKASDRLRYTAFGHGEFFEACQILRAPGGTVKPYKYYVRRHAPFIKEVAPYPLP